MTSINIQPMKNGCEMHDTRRKELGYVRKELTHLNESWADPRYAGMSMAEIRRDIDRRYHDTVGQHLQKKAVPLREGVVVIDNATTMEQLRQLARNLETRFGIKTMQIHVHRDEGHWREGEWHPNLHAHMLFDWTWGNGKSVALNRTDMSAMQTVVANTLGMQRGVSSDRKHLDIIQYKNKVEEDRNLELQQEKTELQEESQTLKADNKQLTADNQKLQQELTELEKRKAELEKIIKGLNITKKGRDAMLERLNGLTNLLGKSHVQKELDARNEELANAEEQLTRLEEKVKAIEERLAARTKERDDAIRERDSYKRIKEQKEYDLEKSDRELHATRKQFLEYRKAHEPRRFVLPDVVNMKHSGITRTPSGYSLKVFIAGRQHAVLAHLKDNDYQNYIEGKVSLEELIGGYCSYEIDVAIARRLRSLRGSDREAAIKNISNTMFCDVLRVLRSLVGQGTYMQSVSGGNPRVRHKDEWEIMQELKEQGYSVHR